MKCCFCGAELKEERYALTYDVAVCPNKKCDVYDQEINVKVWQALIDGKKAQEELRVYKKAYDILDTSILELLPQLNHLVCSGFLQARRQKTKDCIASITKGDKK